MCSILGLVFLLVVVDECSIAVFLVEIINCTNNFNLIKQHASVFKDSASLLPLGSFILLELVHE
jgi:hypothetical protein